MNVKKKIYLCLIILGIYLSYSVAGSNYQSGRMEKFYNEIGEEFIEGEKKSEVINEEGTEIVERSVTTISGNSDAIGWIIIPGTKINYPVLKTTDNDYYLKNNVKKEKDKNGAIYMDFRNDGDASDRHTIIYGHHTKDKTMFTDLMKYKKKDFFDKNKIIKLNLGQKNTEWEIFSVYITATNFYYIITDFTNDEEYGKFLNFIRERSMFNRSVTISDEDQLLTLSTCTFEFDNARFVVHARRVK